MEVHLQLMGAVQLEGHPADDARPVRLGRVIRTGRHLIYKETIAHPVEGVGHFEPLRHYAETHVLLEPLPARHRMRLASVCSEDVLDRNWQRLILQHCREREHLGVLTGSPITDMKITLLVGRAHLKHTEGGDFRQATYRAIRQGLMEAKERGDCRLPEPWYGFRFGGSARYGRPCDGRHTAYERLVLHAFRDGEYMVLGVGENGCPNARLCDGCECLHARAWAFELRVRRVQAMPQRRRGD